MTEGPKAISEPLNGILLEQQQSLFKLMMRQNAPKIMAEPQDQNPLSKLWNKLSTNSLLMNRMSEWFKCAKIAIVAVIGSVENE